MPPLRWKLADLQPHQHLLLREADPGATHPGAPSGDPEPDQPAAVRQRRGSKGGSGSRFRLKAWQPLEKDVVSTVLTALLYHPKVADAYRMNTGAGKLLFADGTTSQFIRFGKKGSPDIHGYLKDGRALFVECKRPTGSKRRAEQVEWIERARTHGCVAFFAVSADDVREHLG